MILQLEAPGILKSIFTRYRCTCRSISSLNLWNEEISSSIKHQIEKHWQTELQTEKFNENDSLREKYYVLSMFPYPSGFLHMGHVRVYTISDTIARFQRMNGRNVIHPIGWDAFGLPAENAAIDRQIPPEEWTQQNIQHMKQQLKQLGCSFEWHRELSTCDPKYYKWTQDLFLKLFDAGLIYQKEALVNWDPIDQTVLADEQVDENGCSWRSGAKVEKKLLKQWFVRTTQFAKDLLKGLDDTILYDWRDIIKLQKHWIGNCNGVNFNFKVVGGDSFVTFWTSKPEYIKHVKFVAVNDDHIFAKKEGISFKQNGNCTKLQVEVENCFTNEIIPVFVTNEIEFLPFTDSYLGIPGISEEASEFAHRHSLEYNKIDKIIDNKVKLREIQNSICEEAKRNNNGGYWSSAKLRDWLISRQRYWGTPIPIIHCEKCGSQPVPRDHLPVELPKLSKLSQKGSSLLTEVTDWINTNCPNCKGPAKRETDTMDTFVDSSWYFLRYLNPKNSKEMFDTEQAKKMTPVDLYIGGKEHAVLHLYYARFISHFLYSLGLLPEREPFKRLLVQGMVMGRSYRIKGTGKYLMEKDVKVIDLKRNKAEVKETGEPVVVTWEKMSKSKFNGVDPEDMFKEYGTDTTRLLILADVAPTSHRNWNSNTFPGIINWQKRLWLTIRDFIQHRKVLPPVIPEDQFKTHDDYLFDSRNYYVKGATFNYFFTQQLSIAVSKQQGLTNSIRRAPPAVFAHSPQFERALAAQIVLLAPMAPYFASELWSGFVSASNRLNNSDEILWEKSVLEQRWPEVDATYKVDLVCQVNGNEIHTVKIARDKLDTMNENEAVELVLNVNEVKEGINSRNVVGSHFTLYKGCEGVVNIVTERVPSKKRESISG